MNSGLGFHQLVDFLQLPPVTVQIVFRPKCRVYIDLRYQAVHFDLRYSLLRLFFNVASFDQILLSPC